MSTIIGLGNPGPDYEQTRHNAGFLAVDELARQFGWEWRTVRSRRAEIVKTGNILLVKPQGGMNDSGPVLRRLLAYYRCLPAKISADDGLTGVLTVIHDDLDLALGTWREASASGSAGHKGVQSIIDAFGTKKFRRFRIGIRPDAEPVPEASTFVLGKFTPAETDALNRVIGRIILILKAELKAA